ncbi:MAG: SDR family NAD(P)-dependent oxidoreductase [Bacillota bacterium]|nr:SDR family NAD(P)-dependent oxidoreductase [Bacillota bacterium]
MHTTRVALVTGSGRGLGRAIAIELARRGLAVVVNSSRNPEQAGRTAELIRAAGGQAEAVVADVSSPADVARLFEAIDRTFGRLDVLVNNAGINRDVDFREMSDRQWFDVLATNLSGPFLCSRAAVPLMDRAGGGSIVNITARTAYRPRKRGANYCAAKAGLSMLCQCMALELAPSIRVNCVAPGTTDTAEVRERFDLDTPDGMARMLAPIPLGRIATPEEVARFVAYVALDAGFMTGQDVLYDGGRNLT